MMVKLRTGSMYRSRIRSIDPVHDFNLWNVWKWIGWQQMRLICCAVAVIALANYFVQGDIEIATAPNEYLVFEESLYFEILWPETLMYTYKLRQARDFGTSFTKAYERIELVLADPEEGCQDLWNDVSGSVVMILRGGCSFLTKSKVAERAGAVAVIIADNDESNDMNMIDMVDDNTQRVVRIPSFFLLGKDGQMIRRQLNVVRSDRALITIPVNLTGKAFGEVRRPPWTVW